MNDIDELYILDYGKSYEENKKRFPNITYIDYKNTKMVLLDNIHITPYILDCSSVLFHYCCRASNEAIQKAIDFCSFNGFDKIFHTHTSYNADYYYAFKDRLIKLGFTYINAGKSNRNPDHFCGIFVYHIPKCESTGYNF